MKGSKATVGRVVHFYEGQEGPYAAIVSGVNEDDAELVHLHVLYPLSPVTRKYDKLNVAYSEKGVEKAGTWRWPPRAPTNGFKELSTEESKDPFATTNTDEELKKDWDNT
jgi:hypothetical protein